MKKRVFILLMTIIGLSLFAMNIKSHRDIMRKAPYILYMGNNTEMKLVWQLNSTATCDLMWGTDTSYNLGNAETSQYNNSHQHTYTIPDLSSEQIYYYKITVDQEVYEGSFRAASEENATNLKFMVYGDTRSHPSVHDQVATAIVETYNNDENYHTFVINSGDLVYNGSSESDWDNQFFNPYFPNIQAMLRTLPYQACVGNHEDSGDLFSKYFSYPFVNHHYWSYDYGPAHITIIDQFINYNPGSAEYNWIVNDLASSDKSWKFIILHKPGWSAGGHGNNSDVQNYIQPLCIQYGVSVVFAGHNHYYSRAVVDGITHITTGGGGAPLYEPNLSYPHIVTATEAYHFCKVNIQGDQLNFTAVTPQGEEIDNFSLSSPSNTNENTINPIISLSQAQPNPFNPQTKISFSIDKTSNVKLTIFNIKGKIVNILVNKKLPGGRHDFLWNGKNKKGNNVSSGVYFYRLDIGNKTVCKKMTLLK